MIENSQRALRASNGHDLLPALTQLLAERVRYLRRSRRAQTAILGLSVSSAV